MAEKSRTREITITDEGGTFGAILRRFRGNKDYDFEGIGLVRRLLSNEKARLLHTLKTKKPGSIYELAKRLGRDFKSVNDDVKLLELFGFIEMISEKTGNRQRRRPVLVASTMNLVIKL